MSAIDYDLRKIRAVAFDVDGVLSPSLIPMDTDGVPCRMANIKDGFALQLAVKRGLRIAIITGGVSEAVRMRYSALGIKDVFQGAGKKLPVLEEWLERHKLSKEEVAYMGDDIPDLPCLRAVGLPTAPSDAAWEVKETSLYVSRFMGGYGCVRDLLEQILKSQNLWLNDADAFGW